MNTYNLNLSSEAPQPRIPGLAQSPPIGNRKIWYEGTVNSKGLYTGLISRSTDTWNGEYVDIFKIKNTNRYDWSNVILDINPELVKDNETITFDIWTKSNLGHNTGDVRAGIAEGNKFGQNSKGFTFTSLDPVSTNGDWKLFRAERVLSFQESHGKPNIFFGTGYDAVGETVWTKPTITFGNANGIVDIFKIPDHYGATKLNLNFVNLFDGDYKYIKFLISHNQTDEVWMLQEFNDVFLIKAQQFPVYLYPTLHEVNEYIVSVSAIRTDLQVERYDIHANIKRPDITDYGEIDIVQTRLFNNEASSNNLFLAMETENPRYLINSMLKLPKNEYQKQNINLTYFDPMTGQFPVYKHIEHDITTTHGPSNNPSNHFIPLHTLENTDGDIEAQQDYTLVFDAKISEGQNYYAWRINRQDESIYYSNFGIGSGDERLDEWENLVSNATTLKYVVNYGGETNVLVWEAKTTNQTSRPIKRELNLVPGRRYKLTAKVYIDYDVDKGQKARALAVYNDGGGPKLYFGPMFYGDAHPYAHDMPLGQWNEISGEFTATDSFIRFDVLDENGSNNWSPELTDNVGFTDIVVTELNEKLSQGSWATGVEIPGKTYSSVKPLTHEWIRHYVPITSRKGDDIVISMVSSDKSGNPVLATHVNPLTGQTLSLRNIVLSKTADVNPDFVPVEL